MCPDLCTEVEGDVHSRRECKLFMSLLTAEITGGREM